MDLSPTDLFLSIFTGALGFALFLYGKKQSRLPQLIGGIALGVYPLFVTGALWLSIIGIAIVAGVIGAVRAGF